MKRCPECRRDYYDNTLLYCLDDGAALLDGPSSLSDPDEPKTAILHETDAPNEPATKPLLHTTAVPAVANHSSWIGTLLAIAAVAIVLVAAFFVYRYSKASTRQINSIAVIPFVNESGNADVEYLSDGMTDTLIASLSQIPNLSVKAHSSVFRYKGKELDAKKVAADLGVQAIVTGRLNQRGDQLVLNLELIDPSTESDLWANRYERKTSDLVPLQSEVARDVSSKLKARLSGADEAKITKHYTANPEAYQLYLKGRFYAEKRREDDLKKALEYFQQAVELDPNYALAYTGVAGAWGSLSAYNYGHLTAKEANEKSEAAVQKALQLDDSLSEPHATLANIKAFYNWDWNGAEAEYKRAIELNPNDAAAHRLYGRFLCAFGRIDEAKAEIELAYKVDPLSLGTLSIMGDPYYYSREYDKLIEANLKALELDPSFSRAHYWLQSGYEEKGMYQEVIADLRKTASPDDLKAANALEAGYSAAGARGYWQKNVELKLEEAKQHYLEPYPLAVYYAKLGEKDKAFEWLQKAYEERDAALVYLKVDPQIDNLRPDPRSQEIVKKVGLPN
ncbi:MAG: tetratricopeptide repeat protein [Pyrinomonadaceae bacterium]